MTPDILNYGVAGRHFYDLYADNQDQSDLFVRTPDTVKLP